MPARPGSNSRPPLPLSSPWRRHRWSYCPQHWHLLPAALSPFSSPHRRHRLLCCPRHWRLLPATPCLRRHSQQRPPRPQLQPSKPWRHPRHRSRRRNRSSRSRGGAHSSSPGSSMRMRSTSPTARRRSSQAPSLRMRRRRRSKSRFWGRCRLGSFFKLAFLGRENAVHPCTPPQEHHDAQRCAAIR